MLASGLGLCLRTVPGIFDFCHITGGQIKVRETVNVTADRIAPSTRKTTSLAKKLLMENL